MKPGTQIAYVPTHAHHNLADPDVEFGFVVKEHVELQIHFCRYWRRGEPGILRTTANAEATPTEYLVEHQSVPQELVDRLMEVLHL